MRTFRLYPVEARWWSFNDYGAVLDIMALIPHGTVLEFGPGSSTLALVEGGARRIYTCEDEKRWEDVYRKRLVDRFPGVVTMVPYVWADPLTIPAIDDMRWDMALIDGPKTTPRRYVSIEYAVQRCANVVVCTEDEGRKHNSYLRPIIEMIANVHKRRVRYFETGPEAGGFALIQP